MVVIPGIYQLRIRLRRPAVIHVGALGSCRFVPGWYVYTGSARNGLLQRICRHLRSEKKPHWHIDCLLPFADCVEPFVLPGLESTECDLHQSLRNARVPVTGFGSSDCSCPSHLAYFQRRPALDLLPWSEFLRSPACRLAADRPRLA